MGWDAPNENNGYLEEHAALLASSYQRWTGKDLTDPQLTGARPARALYEAPFALVSHGTEQDPIFNYGNRTAQRLFEMTWEEFSRLPSRMSAEPVHRDERERLMNEVRRNGFIPDYHGVRISKNGRRFYIEQAIVWNVMDSAGMLRGQAAMFAGWHYLVAGG